MCQTWNFSADVLPENITEHSQIVVTPDTG